MKFKEKVEEFVENNEDLLVGLGTIVGMVCLAYKLGNANGKLKATNEAIKLSNNLGRNQ